MQRASAWSNGCSFITNKLIPLLPFQGRSIPKFALLIIIYNLMLNYYKIFKSNILAQVFSVMLMKHKVTEKANENNWLKEHNKWTACWHSLFQVSYSIIRVSQDILTLKVLCNWSLSIVSCLLSCCHHFDLVSVHIFISNISLTKIYSLVWLSL